MGWQRELMISFGELARCCDGTWDASHWLGSVGKVGNDWVLRAMECAGARPWEGNESL